MIQEVSINDIPGRATRYNNAIMRDIEDFLKSEWTIAEVRIEKYKNVGSAHGSYWKTAKKMGADILVSEREGRLFLIKKQ